MKRRILWLCIAAGMLTGCGGSFVGTPPAQQPSSGASGDVPVCYEMADACFLTLTQSAQFLTGDLETRRDAAARSLAEMAQSGYILANYYLNEVNSSYYFEFAAGGEGCIALTDPSDELDSLTGPENVPYTMADGTLAEALAAENFFCIGEMPRALLVDTLGDTGNAEVEPGVTIRQCLQDDVAAWNANGMTTDYSLDPTYESCTTLLRGYDLIVLRCHGILDQENHPAVVMGTITTEPWEEPYLNDLIMERIGVLYRSNEYGVYLTDKFFRDYYLDELYDSIIWVGCCKGYWQGDDTLVSMLADCGAKAVIGATDSVLSVYGTLMVDAFVNRLLLGKPVQDALDFAKSVYGADDAAFCSKLGSQKTVAPPAEFRLYKGEKAQLMDLGQSADQAYISGRVIDQNGAPVEGASITFSTADASGSCPDPTVTGWDGSFITELRFHEDEPECVFDLTASAQGYENTVVLESLRVSRGDLRDVGDIVLQSPELTDDQRYADVLAKYRNEIIPNGIDDLESYSDTWYYTTGKLSDYGYFYYDIDRDGANELFVMDCRVADRPRVTEIYTISGGKIVTAGVGGARWELLIIGADNVILCEGSSGYDIMSDTFCHLEDGKLVPFECFYCKHGTWYYAAGRDCEERAASEAPELRISEDEMYAEHSDTLKAMRLLYTSDMIHSFADRP